MPALHPRNSPIWAASGLSVSQSPQGSAVVPPSPHSASRGLRGGAEGRRGHTRTSRTKLFRELEGAGRKRGRRRGGAEAAGTRSEARRSLSLRGHQNHFLKLPGRTWPEPPRRKQPFRFPSPPPRSPEVVLVASVSPEAGAHTKHVPDQGAELMEAAVEALPWPRPIPPLRLVLATVFQCACPPLPQQVQPALTSPESLPRTATPRSRRRRPLLARSQPSRLRGPWLRARSSARFGPRLETQASRGLPRPSRPACGLRSHCRLRGACRNAFLCFSLVCRARVTPPQAGVVPVSVSTDFRARQNLPLHTTRAIE